MRRNRAQCHPATHRRLLVDAYLSLRCGVQSLGDAGRCEVGADIRSGARTGIRGAIERTAEATGGDARARSLGRETAPDAEPGAAGVDQQPRGRGDEQASGGIAPRSVQGRATTDPRERRRRSSAEDSVEDVRLGEGRPRRRYPRCDPVLAVGRRKSRKARRQRPGDRTSRAAPRVGDPRWGTDLVAHAAVWIRCAASAVECHRANRRPDDSPGAAARAADVACDHGRGSADARCSRGGAAAAPVGEPSRQQPTVLPEPRGHGRRARAAVRR